MNEYTKKYLKMLKKRNTDKDKEKIRLIEIIDKVYQDGFEDGQNVRDDE